MSDRGTVQQQVEWGGWPWGLVGVGAESRCRSPGSSDSYG